MENSVNEIKKTNDTEEYVFEWKPFIKELASIGIPIASQSLLTTTASMVDTMMVAPLGELTVGALGLCSQYASLIFSCYAGFMGGGALFMAQYWGAKDKKGVERSYGMTLTFMFTVGIIFSMLALFFPWIPMQLYTDKVSIQEIGVQYLRVVGVAYLLQIWAMAMSTMLKSTEEVRIPLYSSLVSVGSNVFLNWVFIYGHFGFKAMGIRGAAYATTVAAGINVFMILMQCFKKKNMLVFHVRNHFRWDKESIKLYIKKSFPIICNELFVGIGFSVISIVMGRQSERVISAYAVFKTLEGFIISFFIGFSSSASILVGTVVGAGMLDKAFARAKRLVYLCQGVVFLVGVCLVAVHKPLLSALSLSGESLTIGFHFLVIYCVAAVIRMGNWIQNDTYRSAGDAVTGTVLEIIFMYVLLIPTVVITGIYLKLPYYIVFACSYIDEPIRYCIMQRHMYSGRWIRPVTDIGKAALPSFWERHNLKGNPKFLK